MQAAALQRDARTGKPVTDEGYDGSLQQFLAPWCQPFAVELELRGVGALAEVRFADGARHVGVVGRHEAVVGEMWFDAGGICPVDDLRTWVGPEGGQFESITRFGKDRWVSPLPDAPDPRPAVDLLMRGKVAKRDVLSDPDSQPNKEGGG